MSFLSRIFKKKKEEDYEIVLSNLARDIQKRHVKLSEIRLRERRATLLVTLYTLAGWLAYVSMWYLELLPTATGPRRGVRIGKAVKASPVVVGPIIILFIRRIVQIWYASKGDAEEKTLQTLMKQQKLKVDEIKKKTNYESTRNLIQKYEATTPTHPLTVPVQLKTPQRPLPQSPQSPLGPSSSPLATPPQITTPRKQWYDKIADAVLGDDDYTPNIVSSRYALICEKCFAHNGLVKEAAWADTQYVCPKCNHFNASHNSKKARGRSAPSSPVQYSPQTPLDESSRSNALREPSSPTTHKTSTELDTA